MKDLIQNQFVIAPEEKTIEREVEGSANETSAARLRTPPNACEFHPNPDMSRLAQELQVQDHEERSSPGTPCKECKYTKWCKKRMMLFFVLSTLTRRAQYTGEIDCLRGPKIAMAFSSQATPLMTTLRQSNYSTTVQKATRICT